jgi:hypothetical protein
MTTIILTSTVNVHHNATFVFQKDSNDRIQTYLSSILKWLYNTNFNIVLVENSGYNFNELDEEKQKFKDRFEVIVFHETKLDEAKFIQNEGSKGRHEIFAINYAFNNSKILSLSNFIIKITARYYIPELEEYLNYYDLNNYDCLVQNNRNRCEVVGSHIKYFSDIFDMHINHDHIENEWKLRTSKYDNILICKIFQIDETQRGGDFGKFTTI